MGITCTYEVPGRIAWKPKLSLWKLYRGSNAKLRLLFFFIKIEITEQPTVWNISNGKIDSSTVLHVTSLQVVRIITFWKANLPFMPNNGKGFKPCSGFTVYLFGLSLWTKFWKCIYWSKLYRFWPFFKPWP